MDSTETRQVSRSLGSTEGGIVALVPRAPATGGENDFPPLRDALRSADIDHELIEIDAVEQTIEDAMFMLDNELGAPDVVFLLDATAPGYDPALLAQRCIYHFPKVRTVLIGATGSSDADPFQRVRSAHFAAAIDSLAPVLAIAENPEFDAATAAPAGVSVNRAIFDRQAKMSEVIASYTKKTVEGQGFSDVWLNTPVAPASLPEEETVGSILGRDRVCGRVLLVIPSQFNVYGVEIPPAYPALGVLWIAAMLEKAGHYVEVIDQDADGINLPEVVQRVTEGRFDVLGITATTPTFPNAVAIASEAKKANPAIRTILGGIHATIDPMNCAKETCLDYIAVGEAECTAVELVDAIMANDRDISRIKGIVTRTDDGEILATGARSLAPELDDYPPPAMHLINHLDKYEPADAEFLPVAPVMVSRGCPGQCTYCQTKNIFGRRTRFRSPQNVIEEIRHLVETYGVKEIHFLDDVITANKPFVREFCTLLKQEPYKLRLQVANGLRADMVNEEILTLLRDVGLTNVGFGIESGSERVLKVIKKGINKDRVRKAVDTAKGLGLDTWGFFMIGLPGDDEESIKETIEFAVELDVKFAKFLILKPFPGSEVYYQLDEKGLIDSRDYSMYGVYTRPVHHLESLSDERILELQKYAFRRFYLRPRKLLEHLLDIRTFDKFVTFLRGSTFIFARMFKRQAAGIGVNTGG